MLTGPTMTIIGAVCFALAFLSAVGLLVEDAHDRVAVAAAESARQLALSLEREVSRNIDLIDLSIQATADGVEQPVVMALPRVLREQLLFSRAAAARYIRNISVFDRDGRLIADSLSTLPSTQGRSGGAPFIPVTPQPAPAGDALFIGQPYLASDSTTRLVRFSRNRRTPQGIFSGVVTATVNLNDFSEVFYSLNVMPGTMVRLSTRNGVALLRDFTPPSAQTARESGSPGLTGRMLIALAMIFSKPADASLVAERPVPGTPLILSVQLSSQTVFADWRRWAIQLEAYSLFVSSLFLAGALYLTHVLRMRMRSEAVVTRLASIDSLTQLPNRRALDSTYSREVMRAARECRPLSVLFVDIDHFKTYNDQYGHVAGDHTLQAVADAVRACLRRDTDFVARYGGEEFVAILPDTAAREATALADVIRLAVRDLRRPHASVEAGVVTASIGVASYDRATDRATGSLLERADRALYAAKRTGRDRVTLCPTPAVEVFREPADLTA
ncbi:GGDEF domain-containing protein [Robbsia betulipollinis]|nr:diguanylate cyclase [Robbsia betulipollinis]